MRLLCILSLLFAGLTVSLQAGAADARYSKAKCERMEQRVQKLNSQLRAGGHGKQVKRWKQKRRSLEAKRSQHCRRY